VLKGEAPAKQGAPAVQREPQEALAEQERAMRALEAGALEARLERAARERVGAPAAPAAPEDRRRAC
jgi:hypothetical protein